MTEFEQRLTHEYSKLAEQYAREQKAHIEWASHARGATTTNGAHMSRL